jgi:hypothetical protein
MEVNPLEVKSKWMKGGKICLVSQVIVSPQYSNFSG